MSPIKRFCILFPTLLNSQEVIWQCVCVCVRTHTHFVSTNFITFRWWTSDRWAQTLVKHVVFDFSFPAFYTVVPYLKVKFKQNCKHLIADERDINKFDHIKFYKHDPFYGALQLREICHSYDGLQTIMAQAIEPFKSRPT